METMNAESYARFVRQQSEMFLTARLHGEAGIEGPDTTPYYPDLREVRSYLITTIKVVAGERYMQALMRHEERALDLCDAVGKLMVCRNGIHWGGYAQYFDPNIPSRIGYEFSSAVATGVRMCNMEGLEKASTILSRPHRKNVHEKYSSAPPTQVLCRPTKAAEELRDKLAEMSLLLQEFNNQLEELS